MCLFNKILIGLIVIAIGACFYFSAITLKTHSFWREAYNNSRNALPALEEEINRYEYGKGIPNTDGYLRSNQELKEYLQALKDIREKVYNDCNVESQFTAEDGGTFDVSIPGMTSQATLEAELPINTPLFVFIPNNADALRLQYLGSFRVVGHERDADGSTEFHAVLEPKKAEYEKNPRLSSDLAQAAGKTWTIFKKMPIDKAEPGSDNEDYIPFETKINYYVEQENILSTFIEKQKKKHIAKMDELLGSAESPRGTPALAPIATAFKKETVERKKKDGSYMKNLWSLYKDFEAQNKAMKDANDALASEVQRLENQKQGYERSIDQRMKPISMKK